MRPVGFFQPEACAVRFATKLLSSRGLIPPNAEGTGQEQAGAPPRPPPHLCNPLCAFLIIGRASRRSWEEDDLMALTLPLSG